MNHSGFSLGKFDINTPDGFEHLVSKIGEISESPAVQKRTRSSFFCWVTSSKTKDCFHIEKKMVSNLE